MTHAWTHAWCKSPARDEAVRAAEDGRDRPLPTLEECIETAFSAGVRDSFRKVEEAWAMIPKSVSASSPVGHEKKGDGMATERVTLEFEVERGSPPSEWPWSYILSRSDALKMRPGESVRVVEEGVHGWKDMAASLSADVLKLTAERDAAIRERQSLREQLESVACRAATAETALAEIKSLDYTRAAVNGAAWQANKIAAKALEAASVGNRPETPVSSSQAASGGGEQLREQVAAIVHEAMRFYRVAETATWQGGNSFAEDRARQAAAEIVELLQAASGGEGLTPHQWSAVQQLIDAAEGAQEFTVDAFSFNERVVKLRSAIGAARRLLTDPIPAPAASGGEEQSNQPLADGGRPREEPAESATADSSPSLFLDTPGAPADRADPTASGGGEGEPVAWMCEWTDNVGLHHTKTDAEDEANGDIVPQPLYRAPPQPRGWLTDEEREVLQAAKTYIPGGCRPKGVIDDLLDRSTPPEVRLPLADLGDRLLRDSVIHALAEAGVAVKEVGE
jgi:hypothetical protein